MDRKAEEFIEKLYRAEYGKLLCYASSRVGSTSRAQDLVQDTFHDAICKIEMLQQHPKPEAWLMMTLKNKVFTCQREKLRYIKRFSSFEELESTLPAGGAELWEAPDEAAYNRAMQSIRSALTEDEFYLFKRLILDEASHLETAAELNITVWASQQRLSRIKKKLLKHFPGRKKYLKNFGKICQFLLLAAIYR